jgi:predicted DCC family thiol-disulfide oxidoreductase YuxK
MSSTTVFFDGVCNLCSGSVQFIIRHDKCNRFKFASLQSEYAKKELVGADLKNVDSIVLKKDEKIFVKSGAALRIASFLGFPINLLMVFIIIPPFIRNFVYDVIARNRYKWFGKKEVCWIPSPDLKSKFLD